MTVGSAEANRIGMSPTDVGAQVTYSCLQAKKDVAVLNVEMDVTIGPLLHNIAASGGVVYTVCHGDEPIEAKVLVDFARDLQFEIIAAGKGKNNPFEPLSTPDTVRDRALSRNRGHWYSPLTLSCPRWTLPLAGTLFRSM